MDGTPIQVIVLEPVLDSVRDLLQTISRSKQAEIMELASTEEAYQVAQQFQPCVLVVCMRGSMDGATQLELLKKLQKSIRSDRVKPLVVSSMKGHPLAGEIAKIGVTDYVEEPFQPRSLLFKINLMFKTVNSIRKKESGAGASEELVVKAEGPKPESRKGEVPANYKPALQLGEDIFVFRKAFPRKVGGVFVLKAEGPDPDTGQWQRERMKPGQTKPSWRWVPKKAEGEPDDKNDGGDGWVQTGEEPSYNPKTKQWQFRSEQPELFLRKKGKNAGSKVRLGENGVVEIADDSATALENLVLNRKQAEHLRELAQKKIFEESAKKKESGPDRNGGTEDKKSPKKGFITEEEEENGREAKRSLKPSKAEEEGEEKILGEAADSESLEKRELARLKNKKKLGEKEIRSGEGEEESEALQPKPLEAEKATQEEELLVEGEPSEEAIAAQRKQKNKAARPKKSKQGEGHLASEDEEKKSEALGLQKSEEEKEAEKALKQMVADADAEAEERAKAREKNRTSKKKTASRASLAPHPMAEKERIKRERKTELAKKRLAELRKRAKEEAEAPILEPKDEEEERKLRHELGIKRSEKVSRARLARLARAATLKALKKEMEDITASLEGRGVPLEGLFAEEEAETDPLVAELGPKKDRAFRAIDSIDEEAKEGFFSSEGPSKKKKQKKEKKEGEEKYFYLSRQEVEPQGGVWEEAEGKWAYVPATIFSEGFEALEDLLPTWIYEGETEPELLEAEDRWRFEGTAPYRVEQAEELSPALQESLESVREQAEAVLGIEASPKKKKELLGSLEPEDASYSEGDLPEESASRDLENKATLAEESLKELSAADAKLKKPLEEEKNGSQASPAGSRQDSESSSDLEKGNPEKVEWEEERESEKKDSLLAEENPASEGQEPEENSPALEGQPALAENVPFQVEDANGFSFSELVALASIADAIRSPEDPSPLRAPLAAVESAFPGLQARVAFTGQAGLSICTSKSEGSTDNLEGFQPYEQPGSGDLGVLWVAEPGNALEEREKNALRSLAKAMRPLLRQKLAK